MFLKPTEHCPSDGTHRPVCQPVRRGSFATIPPLYCQSPDKGGQQGPSCALALPFASPVKPAAPEKLHSVRCLVVHLLEESSSEASESAPANLRAGFQGHAMVKIRRSIDLSAKNSFVQFLHESLRLVLGS